MKNLPVRAIWLPIACVAYWMGASNVCASLAEQITQKRVFKDPLFYISSTAPTEAESHPVADLLRSLAREDDPRKDASLIEAFIRRWPDSPWTPSLRFHLGEYYRDHGRFTLALDHWEKAWAAVNGLDSRGGRAVAEYVAVSLGRLLLSLGQHERLAGLLAQTDDRKFDDGRLQIAMDGLRENFAGTAASPQHASLCGIAALITLAEMVAPTHEGMLARLRGYPGKVEGLSLHDLQRIADAVDLAVKAIRFTDTVPVPSLVHYQQQHFAVVVAKAGGRYKVRDPVFERPRWIHEEDLLAELSGLALVTLDEFSKGHEALSAEEAAAAVGRGYPNAIDDSKDWFTGSGTPYGPPSWDVSEPFINLWIELVASTYPMADGSHQKLSFLYGQRQGWMSHWSGYVDYSYYYDYEHQEYMFEVYQTVLPRGGVRFYTIDGIPREQFELGVLTENGSHQYNYMNWKMTYPDGKKAYFAYQDQYELGYRKAYLTSAYDQFGRGTFVTNEKTNGVVRVKRIRDYEARDTLFEYDAANPSRVVAITDPYGRTNRFYYNGSGQLVTNRFAPDMASAFIYDDKGVVTNLTTVFGTTSFKYTSNTNGGNVVTRSMLVTLPTGAHHLYMYRDQCTKLNASTSLDFLPFSYPTNEVPQTAPFTNTFDNTWMDARNSFHWSPLAYQKLSAQFRSSGNFDDLTLDDYKLAALSHWLRDDTGRLSQDISLVRAASPDGTTEGSRRWFDYWGKTSVIETNQGQVITNWYNKGTHPLPRFIAQPSSDFIMGKG